MSDKFSPSLQSPSLLFRKNQFISQIFLIFANSLRKLPWGDLFLPFSFIWFRKRNLSTPLFLSGRLRQAHPKVPQSLQFILPLPPLPKHSFYYFTPLVFEEIQKFPRIPQQLRCRVHHKCSWFDFLSLAWDPFGFQLRSKYLRDLWFIHQVLI